MRLYMRNENVQPNFDLTQQQQQQFVGTPYENNPLQLKRSIIARIFSGDPSANATEEQRARAQSVIDAFRRYNFK
jgi:hypothetical protein